MNNIYVYDICIVVLYVIVDHPVLVSLCFHMLRITIGYTALPLDVSVCVTVTQTVCVCSGNANQSAV